MREFANLHPFVLFVYFTSMFVIALLSMHPIMVGIFMIMTCAMYLHTYGTKAFFKRFPFLVLMMVLIAISNPIFVHQGVTILGYFNHNPITWEAICYGIVFAGMMGGIWNLSAYAQAYINHESILYLFGRIIPSIALILSMSLHLIPAFKKQLHRIIDAQRLLQVEGKRCSYFQKLRHYLCIFSVLLTWAFESSIDRADSMKARGYGIHRRKNFHNYHVTKRDIIFFLCCIVFLVFITYANTQEYASFYFYPHIHTISTSYLAWLGYISYGCYLLLPMAFERREERTWKSINLSM